MNRVPAALCRGPLRRLVPAALASLLIAVSAGAAQTGSDTAAGHLRPDPVHGSSGQVISELLTTYHYRDQALDDALSEATLEGYFEALDPQRLYFLASDVAAYAPYRDRVDDLLRDGEVALAFEIFDTFQERVAQRSEHAVELLDSEPDYDTDRSFQADRNEAPWAGTSAELDRLWEDRVLNDALTLHLAGEDWSTIKDTLTGRYQRLARNTAQYRPEDVFQIYMNALAGTFDPHTNYLSPRTSENFDINMRLSLEGIGALLRRSDDHTEIVKLIPGGPAARSGELSPGDRIIGVAQGEESMVDVVGWRLADVVDLIRGPKKSQVRLRVLPAETGLGGPPKVVELVRNTIELEEQAAKSRVIEVPGQNGGHRVGMIEIPAFYVDFAAARAGKTDYRSSTRDVRRLIEELQASDGGIDSLVIDLRANAGGSLQEATKLTGLFLRDGPVVQVRRTNGEKEVLRDDDDADLAYSGPLVVLVDRHSASASEIFAAAIQDYGRGVVVGNRTFGKGTVQTLIDLGRFGLGSRENAGRLKLTIAKFYRVTGESTQRLGVSPDISLPSPVSDDEVGEIAAPNALPWDAIEPVRFPEALEWDTLVTELTRRHRARMEQQPALRAVQKEYEFLRQQQSRTEVSLNAAARQAELDRAEQVRLEALNARLEAAGKEPVDSLDAVADDQRPDTLLNEAAAIAADLSDLSQAVTPLQAEREAGGALAN